MATDQGDKQAVIGCQAADKKHKVNVKLLDHSMSISLSLSVFKALSLFLFLPSTIFLTCLSFPARRLFFHFLAFISLFLTLFPALAI